MGERTGARRDGEIPDHRSIGGGARNSSRLPTRDRPQRPTPPATIARPGSVTAAASRSNTKRQPEVTAAAVSNDRPGQTCTRPCGLSVKPSAQPTLVRRFFCVPQGTALLAESGLSGAIMPL